jgi:hypothetical protein
VGQSDNDEHNGDRDKDKSKDKGEWVWLCLIKASVFLMFVKNWYICIRLFVQ